MVAFWSAIIKHGSKPAVFVPPPEGWTLHLSQAALPASVSEGKRVSVVHKAGEDDDSPVVLCTLVAGKQDSVPLDLFLDAYAEFSLLTSTPGAASGVEVHLTGYYSPPDDMPGGGGSSEDEEWGPAQEDEDEDEDDAPDDIRQLKSAMFVDGDDDDEDDEDEDDEDEDDEDEGDEDEDDEPGVTRRPHVTIMEVNGDEDDVKPLKAGKKDTATPAPAQTPSKSAKKGQQAEPASSAKRPAEQPASDKSASKKQAVPGKDEQPSAKKQAAATPQQTPAKGKAAEVEAKPAAAQEVKTSKKNVRTFENGFTIVDVAMGPPNGKLAKKGKRVQMAYVGRLKSNGKVFDASKGKPFTFRLGVGEVIKGWDLGVEGMRVGDKRQLIIPPQLAYGSQGVKGAIPPNATLEFDIELKDVK